MIRLLRKFKHQTQIARILPLRESHFAAHAGVEFTGFGVIKYGSMKNFVEQANERCRGDSSPDQNGKFARILPLEVAVDRDARP